MKTLSRKTTGLVAAIALASPLTLGLGGCTATFGIQQGEGASSSASASSQSGESTPATPSDKPATRAPQTGGEEASGHPAATKGASSGSTDTSKVHASQDIVAGNHKFRVDVNSVIVKDGVTTLTMTITNTDTKPATPWQRLLDPVGNNLLVGDRLALVDMTKKLLYRPGKTADGHCLCTEQVTGEAIEAGDSRVLFQTFAALPEDVSTVNVQWRFAPLPFESIPVERR
ncbi:hypothetical protein I6B53_10840 [Schaalia sp. 19OD2882]|uniref:hypothetical protein n=1 Tax=Schaalia sp. 19OD2882 TaxID=2794089 RepID=UPI001C1F02C8|nr:hypothetical protein [Schaalia sp. 19OD2882]QWW19551.1 hypothetical protein I6B53_10840 [Schaalia sp. 19OD2882]